MAGPSSLDPALIRAYRKTIYRVLADPPFDLLLGRDSAALEAWQCAQGVTCSALITAANPRSQPLSDQENKSRNSLLEKDLDDRVALAAENIDPDGAWPVERGFLVAGLTAAQSKRLAERWQQIAWLQSDGDAIPRLEFTRDPALS